MAGIGGEEKIHAVFFCVCMCVWGGGTNSEDLGVLEMIILKYILKKSEERMKGCGLD